jgi:hypothetical protein
MSKNTHYFSHDYNAREDEKIKRLIFKHGWNGYGLYWAIIEMLYINEGHLTIECERIAFDLRTEESIIKSIINDFDLFKTKQNKFYSASVLSRLKIRKEKSNKAKKSAEARWGKGVQDDANALPTDSDSNAIKESKVKEKKENNNKDISGDKSPPSTKKNIIERENEFRLKVVSDFESKYGMKTIKEFCDYWTESNENGKKMKFEKQTTFDISRRLSTWASRDFSKPKKEEKKDWSRHSSFEK